MASGCGHAVFTGRGTPGRSEAARRALTAATFALLLAPAAAGAVLAGGMLAREAASERPPAQTPGIGQYLPTAFGSIGVRDASVGPTGVPRGVEEPRTPPKVQLRVLLSLVNVDRRRVVLPASGFRLHVNRYAPALAPLGSRGVVRVRPSGRLDLSLTFVARRPKAPSWIEFRPPGGGRPILIELSRPNRASEGGPAYGTHPGH